MTVDVLLPYYGDVAMMKQAVESILGQTSPDWTLTVIDDGYPDESIPGYFGALAAQDSRIAYLRNEKNLGPEGNWNRCLQVARGTYFKLLPHDDLLRPDCLEQQVAVLQGDEAHRYALVFCARDVIGSDGRQLMRRGFPGAKSGPISRDAAVRACVRRGTNLIGEPGAVLCRKSLVDRIGAYDGTNPYVIDLDYCFRLLEHGDAWYSAEPLAAFRVSAQQWSVVIGSSQSKDFLDFLARVEAGAPLPLSPFDRFCGSFTPKLNNLARLLFYRFYLK